LFSRLAVVPGNLGRNCGSQEPERQPAVGSRLVITGFSR
jgi:hypothetical protein